MSLENMSEEECSPSKFSRLTELVVTAGTKGLGMHCPELIELLREAEAKYSLEIARAEIERREEIEAKALVGSYTEQIISQLPCNGRYSSSNPVRITIMAMKWGWCWDSWKLNSVLAKELSKQLATFSHVKVSFFVPEGSCERIDKIDAESHNVTIVEAKKQPGFQDPNEWLYFPPKYLTTDIVIGVGEGLCKMAQIFKKYHHCKSVFVGWDSFEESLCIKSKLRNALVNVDSAIWERKSNLRPLMETADHVVAKGPKMAEELSRSLSYRKKRVFKFTPALSSGLPILVHSASGLGEALKDVCGGPLFIVESEDVSEWSKAIKNLRDKERTLRLKEADLLRKHYNEVYSWEKQCGALVEEMRKMASAQQGKTQ